MKKLVFISDFFVNQVAGGGEICDHVLLSLMKEDDTKIIKFNSHTIINKHIRLYRNCGFKFLISNFCNLRYLKILKHPRRKLLIKYFTQMPVQFLLNQNYIKK